MQEDCASQKAACFQEGFPIQQASKVSPMDPQTSKLNFSLRVNSEQVFFWSTRAGSGKQMKGSGNKSRQIRCARRGQMEAVHRGSALAPQSFSTAMRIIHDCSNLQIVIHGYAEDLLLCSQPSCPALYAKKAGVEQAFLEFQEKALELCEFLFEEKDKQRKEQSRPTAAAKGQPYVSARYYEQSWLLVSYSKIDKTSAVMCPGSLPSTMGGQKLAGATDKKGNSIAGSCATHDLQAASDAYLAATQLASVKFLQEITRGHPSRPLPEELCQLRELCQGQCVCVFLLLLANQCTSKMVTERSKFQQLPPGNEPLANELLNSLCVRLSPQLSALVMASHMAVVMEALSVHAEVKRAHGWCLPELLPPQNLPTIPAQPPNQAVASSSNQSGSSNRSAGLGSSGPTTSSTSMLLKDLRPYYLEPTEGAVTNDVELGNNVWLLTGANMAGMLWHVYVQARARVLWCVSVCACVCVLQKAVIEPRMHQFHFAHPLLLHMKILSAEAR
eukprot:1159364-Pelagomonas_calceolata.AAC.7